MANVPHYYTGYFKHSKPAFSIAWDDALKLHEVEEARRILPHLGMSKLKIKEHGE